MNFEKQLHQWVLIDNQMKIVNEKVKELRNAKQTLSQEIMKTVDMNRLSQKTYSINNEKIKFIHTNVSQPITLKYLETCLKDIIPNESQRNQILNYIKQKREIKSQFEIKRL